MPQMMPLNWLLMYMISLLIMLSFISNIYFFKINKLNTKKIHYMSSLSNLKNFYWKW